MHTLCYLKFTKKRGAAGIVRDIGQGGQEGYGDMRRELTAEQLAARDERRATFRGYVERVKKLGGAGRMELAGRVECRMISGHELSFHNRLLVAMQYPSATMLGGYRQWKKERRQVRKGEHGIMIWVPIGGGKTDPEAGPGEDGSVGGDGGDVHFIPGTVFDIGQTDELAPRVNWSGADLEHLAERPAIEAQGELVLA